MGQCRAGRQEGVGGGRDRLKAHSAGDTAAAAEAYNEALKYDATNKFAFYNLRSP